MTVESAVLRFYKMAECDEHGVPLDWDRCRACGGTGWRGGAESLVTTGEGAVVGHMVPADAAEPTDADVCGTCKGHGSLKAAALVFRLRDRYEPIRPVSSVAEGEYPPLRERARCEGCGHPMNDGTWDGVPERYPAAQLAAILDGALTDLCDGFEPAATTTAVHFSPCDEGCRHGGPVRCAGRRLHLLVERLEPEGWTYVETTRFPAGAMAKAVGWDTGGRVEASWRQVDVRPLDWPHDLRPESVAVLCLRCWAERGSGA